MTVQNALGDLALDATLKPVTASGAITTLNSTPAGTATAGSAVEISPAGRALIAIQVAGTYSGALSVQATVDGTNWVTLASATSINTWTTKVQAATIASAATGVFFVSVDGAQKIRVTALAAVTGSATITLVASNDVALVSLDAPLPAGANALGSVSISGTPNVTANPPAATASNLETAAGTNASVVKASSGHLYQLTVSNLTGATIYVKLYNKATAPTVGTDSPKMTIPVAAGAIVALAFGQIGMRFTTGIALAVTGAAAKTDTTAVAAGALVDGSYL